VTDMSEELGGFWLIQISLNREGKHVSMQKMMMKMGRNKSSP